MYRVFLKIPLLLFWCLVFFFGPIRSGIGQEPSTIPMDLERNRLSSSLCTYAARVECRDLGDYLTEVSSNV